MAKAKRGHPFTATIEPELHGAALEELEDELVDVLVRTGEWGKARKGSVMKRYEQSVNGRFLRVAELAEAFKALIYRRHAEWESGVIRVGDWRYLRAEHSIVHEWSGQDLCLSRLRDDRDILVFLERLNRKRWMTPQAKCDLWELLSRIGLLLRGVDASEVLAAKKALTEDGSSR